MAKLKFTAIVADMRGKLNGSVFSKNRAGAYMRTKVTPVNRQTTSQAEVRNRLATFSQGWRGLLAAEIASWNAAVDQFKKTDIFGDIKTPSGINLYVKLNANLDRVSVAAITLPPLPEAVPAVTALSGAAADGANTFTVAYAPTPVPADTAFVISATKQVSPGRSFVGGQYTDILVADAAAVSPANVHAAYILKYGSLIAGQKIGIKIQAINKITGQAGIPISAMVTVA